MRCNIVHPQADELVYEIRRIVISARRMEKAGLEISWENIGDPVAKGEPVPDWIVGHLEEVARENESWGYSPTKGMDRVRQYLAALTNGRGGVQIDEDHVFFFNGLGDAVSKLYHYLDSRARVLCPSPCYPIHASQERFHAGIGAPGMLYHLDPATGWLPDLDEIRQIVKYNREIAGLTIISPDNPTGVVWPRETVQGMVDIAAEFGLFVVADEIYNRLTFGDTESVLLSEIIGDVPGISLKGISKEYPWPGARCGWMEFYNEDSSPQFNRYVRTIFDAKMLEVCSTTMPQLTIPRVMGDPRYPEHLKSRCEAYGKRADEFYETFKDVEGVSVTRPNGAFYAVVVFEPGVLNNRQHLEVENPEAREVLYESLAEDGLSLDKRAVLYILASTGICTVPISGFQSELHGFRMTLLEQDDTRRRKILSTLRDAVERYSASA